MKEYSTDLLKSLEEMLKKGIQSNYEALTLKVLENIQMVAKVIDSDFAQYFQQFMPLMSQILENVDQTTMGNKTLRAKAIETVGEIFASITNCE
jgi:hypothetical protein